MVQEDLTNQSCVVGNQEQCLRKIEAKLILPFTLCRFAFLSTVRFYKIKTKALFFIKKIKALVLLLSDIHVSHFQLWIWYSRLPMAWTGTVHTDFSFKSPSDGKTNLSSSLMKYIIKFLFHLKLITLVIYIYKHDLLIICIFINWCKKGSSERVEPRRSLRESNISWLERSCDAVHNDRQLDGGRSTYLINYRHSKSFC